MHLTPYNSTEQIPEQAIDIRVVIADDHEIFRDGLRLTLGRTPNIKVVAEASNGEELLELVGIHQPHVVLTDIKMPRMDGILAARKISALYPNVGIIGLSMFDEEVLIIEMLHAGALGYLLKNADKTEVIEAIKTVNRGETYYCNGVSKRIMFTIAKSKINPHVRLAADDFTNRELELIRSICEEKSNKDMADHFNVSIRTIEGYRVKIMEKMNVKNTVGMVVYALQHKLYEPSNPF